MLAAMVPEMNDYELDARFAAAAVKNLSRLRQRFGHGLIPSYFDSSAQPLANHANRACSRCVLALARAGTLFDYHGVRFLPGGISNRNKLAEYHATLGNNVMPQ